MNIELIEEVANEIGEYNAVAAGLAELKRKYGGIVVDVSSHSAMTFAKAVRAEIREPRYECEKIRKALKAPALQRAKLIDTEAAQITAELLAMEAPWDEAIKAEEARKELIKAEVEQAEREQAAKIQARIDVLGLNVGLVNSSPDVILAELSRIDQAEVSLEIFGARAGEAAQIKAATRDQLDQLFRAAETRKLQQAELDQQAKALAAAQKKLDDDQAAAVAARMAEDLRLAGLRAEEERRIAAERAKLDADLAAARQAEQAKIDEAARLVREAAAAEQKILDDAAAAERQRLDEVAKAKRLQDLADMQKQADIERREHEAEERVRNKAPDMLDLLKAILECERTGAARIPDQVIESIERIIEQATGEAA